MWSKKQVLSFVQSCTAQQHAHNCEKITIWRWPLHLEPQQKLLQWSAGGSGSLMADCNLASSAGSLTVK